MQHTEIENFEGQVEFEEICNGQGIRRRKAIIRFENLITLKSNSCTVVKLIDNIYREERNKNNCMEIYENIFYSGAYYVAKTLIDEDYFDYTFVTVFNPNNVDVKVNMIMFKVSSYYYQPWETNIHTFPLFYIDEEDLDSDIPSICGFAHQTNGANGIDVIMNNSYIIQPLEILDVPCKMYFYTSTLDFQDLFIMRSRFARVGITIHYDATQRILRVINNNNTPVDLGNRFFQLILPSPICFKVRDYLQQTGHPIVVQHCAPSTDIIRFKTSERKSKKFDH